MLVPDASIDGMLTTLRGTHVTITVNQPTTFAEIATSTPLAEETITNGAGDYSLGDGTPDGRAQTLAGQADMNITADGTANYYCVHNDTDTLYEVYDVSNPQALTTGGTVSVAAGVHTVRDAT